MKCPRCRDENIAGEDFLSGVEMLQLRGDSGPVYVSDKHVRNFLKSSVTLYRYTNTIYFTIPDKCYFQELAQLAE